MSALSSEQFDATLVDVRKAYRLLYSYQRRVMDTIQLIGEKFDRYEPLGFPLFSGMAPREGGKVNFDSWAWDWLPMYCYEFYFGKAVIGSDEYDFAISIYSDSGWEDNLGEHDQTEVENFAVPEKSGSWIYMYVGRNMWKPKSFEDDWSSATSDEFQEQSETGKFISRRLPLSELMTEDAIVVAVDSFKAYCIRQGMGDLFD
ncbi:MAG: hypothetical protein EOO08_00575 [Chitinophagaceae bacterium]|nr:MAG: hypothetical protein EOO08_00575 [Chitinophagaceae bacterium]